MDVARHHALADFERSRAAQRHVLADGRDRVRNRGLDRDAADLGRLDRLDVGAVVQRDLGDHLDEALELLVAGNEIGLRVDFDHDALGARGQRADQAFRRDAAGLLGGLRQALLAQPILRGRHVAVGFGEGCLAVHHACAGRFAQFLDHRRSDRCHRRISFLPVSHRRSARFAPCRRQLQGMLSLEEQSRWPESRPRGVPIIPLPRSASWPARPRHRPGSEDRPLHRSCARCRDRVRRAASNGRCRGR